MDPAMVPTVLKSPNPCIWIPFSWRGPTPYDTAIFPLHKPTYWNINRHITIPKNCWAYVKSVGKPREKKCIIYNISAMPTMTGTLDIFTKTIQRTSCPCAKRAMINCITPETERTVYQTRRNLPTRNPPKWCARRRPRATGYVKTSNRPSNTYSPLDNTQPWPSYQ